MTPSCLIDCLEPIRYNKQELMATSFLDNERNRMKFLVQDVDEGVMMLALALDKVKESQAQNIENGKADDHTHVTDIHASGSNGHIKGIQPLEGGKPLDIESDSDSELTSINSPVFQFSEILHKKRSQDRHQNPCAIPDKLCFEIGRPSSKTTSAPTPPLRSCLKPRSHSFRRPYQGLPPQRDRPRQHARKTALGAALAPILEVCAPRAPASP